MNSKMSLVGMMSQRVNNEHLDASRSLLSGDRHLSAIRVVGKKPAAVFFKNKAICCHAPVGQLDRHNIQTTDHERTIHKLRIGANVIGKPS